MNNITDNKSYSFSINSQRIVRVIGKVALLIIAANLFGQILLYYTDFKNIWFLRIIRLFYVDVEENVPTIFSILLLIIVALLLAIISIIKRNKKGTFWKAWAFLSLGFFAMAIDEAWSFHERLIEPIQALSNHNLPGILKFAWIIPAGLLVLSLILVYWKFIFHLEAKTRIRFLLAGLLYLGGAIGMEMIGGYISSIYGQYNIYYSLSSTLEESLEMAGCIFFISALLKYLAKEGETITVNFLIGA